MNILPIDFFEFDFKISRIYLWKHPTNRISSVNNGSRLITKAKQHSQWIITWKLLMNISENSSVIFRIGWYSRIWYVDWYPYWCQSMVFIDFLRYLFFSLVFVLISTANHVDINNQNRKRQINSNLSLIWHHSQSHRSFSLIHWRTGRFYSSSLLSAFRNEENQCV